MRVFLGNGRPPSSPCIWLEHVLQCAACPLRMSSACPLRMSKHIITAVENIGICCCRMRTFDSGLSCLAWTSHGTSQLHAMFTELRRSPFLFLAPSGCLKDLPPHPGGTRTRCRNNFNRLLLAQSSRVSTLSSSRMAEPRPAPPKRKFIWLLVFDLLSPKLMNIVDLRVNREPHCPADLSL